jgi:hypothetical protein
MFRNIFVKSAKPTPKIESPAQMLKRVEAEAEAERVQMKLDDERRERASRITAERIAALRNDAVTAKTDNAIKRDELFERVINYAPLVIISGLAITGQYGSFSEYLKPTFGEFSGVIAALMALGLESIALFLGLHALKALRRKDSAAGLLLSATVIAGIVAYLNFDHYRLDDGTASIASYAFALFSFVAPFLWRVKIRSDHRNELASNGEIDVRGLKLPRVMWAMHPIKSYSVYRHAAWTGQRDVEIAVKEWENETAEKPVKIKGVNAQDLDMLYALVENLKIDLQETTDDTPQIEKPQRVAITSGHGTEIERFMRHPKWNDGVAIFSASVDSGNPMKVSDLATELGMTNRALAGKIKEYVTTQGRQSSVSNDGSDLAAETA